MLSAGVSALPEAVRNEVLQAVRCFNNFSAENDPYEEHDFAALSCGSERYLWKIDYYDLDLRYASPDPSDPAFTIRVLTIMQAAEY